jgi:hypothetical protein
MNILRIPATLGVDIVPSMTAIIDLDTLKPIEQQAVASLGPPTSYRVVVPGQPGIWTFANGATIGGSLLPLLRRDSDGMLSSDGGLNWSVVPGAESPTVTLPEVTIAPGGGGASGSWETPANATASIPNPLPAYDITVGPATIEPEPSTGSLAPLAILALVGLIFWGTLQEPKRTRKRAAA